MYVCMYVCIYLLNCMYVCMYVCIVYSIMVVEAPSVNNVKDAHTPRAHAHTQTEHN